MLNEELNPGVDKGRLHVGTVVDNKDPKHWGRIRARVTGMFDGIEDGHLPWAIVSLAHPGGASAAHGRFDVPEIGSKVLIEFQNGSPMHPIYKGYFIDETTKLPEAEPNYPRRKVSLFPGGSLIIIDDESKEVFIRSTGDFQLYIVGDMYQQVDGNLVQYVKGDRTTFVDGNDTLVVKGNQMTVADGNITESAKGDLNSVAGGNHNTWADGSALRGAGGTIHDDPPGMSKPQASPPSLPSFPAWEGVRGQKPNDA